MTLLAIIVLPSLWGCATDFGKPEPVRADVTVTAPALSAADRAKCTDGVAAKLVPNPKINEQILIGALKTCDIRKAHVVAHDDDLATVLAGKGASTK